MSDKDKSLDLLDLLKDKSKWRELINCYIGKTSETRIDTEMQDLINRFNEDEIFRQVLIDYGEKQKVECEGNDVLFSWRIYSILHDRKTRSEINTGISRIEKQRKDLKNINRAKLLLEAISKGEAKYKNDKRNVEELREQMEQMDEENSEEIEVLEQKFHEKYKKSVEFFDSMKAQRDQLGKIAEATWSILDDKIRKSEYLGDRDLYRNKYIEDNMVKWILTKDKDPYVKYCTRIHLTGVEPPDWEEIEEEIIQILKNHNLDFLNSKNLEEAVKELKVDD